MDHSSDSGEENATNFYFKLSNTFTSKQANKENNLLM